jgi:hypothetical protein
MIKTTLRFQSVSRLTKDGDILHPEIPNEIAEASRGFAIKVRSREARFKTTG